MGRHASCCLDCLIVAVVDGLTIDPMRDLALSNANGIGQPLLASCDLDGSFDGSHGLNISNAYVVSQQQCCLKPAYRSISVTNMSKRTSHENGDKPPPKELTDLEKQAAKNLRKQWEKMPDSIRPTQEKLGEMYGSLWGDAGITQSMVSQYLNEIRPINVSAAIRFAPIFGCRPRDILDAPELRDFPKADQISLEALWPFESFSYGEYRALSDRQLIFLEGVITGALMVYKEKPATESGATRLRGKKNP